MNRDSQLHKTLTLQRVVTMQPKGFGKQNHGVATYGIRRTKNKRLIWFRLSIKQTPKLDLDELRIPHGSLNQTPLNYQHLDLLRLKAEDALGKDKAKRAFHLACLLIPGLASVYATKITHRLMGISHTRPQRMARIPFLPPIWRP